MPIIPSVVVVVVKVVFFFSSRKINLHNVSVQRNPSSIEGAVDAPREMCFRFVALLSSKHRRAVIIILLVAKAAVASRSIGGVCDTAHPRENDEKTHKGLERRTLNVRVFRATTKKNASSFTSSSRICHRRHLSKRDSHHATMAFPKTKVDFDDDDFEGAFCWWFGCTSSSSL